jgi:hypothetical protein
MVEYVFHALSDAAKEMAVLLYPPRSDPILEDMARIADRYGISTKDRKHNQGSSQSHFRKQKRARHPGGVLMIKLSGEEGQ